MPLATIPMVLREFRRLLRSSGRLVLVSLVVEHHVVVQSGLSGEVPDCA